MSKRIYAALVAEVVLVATIAVLAALSGQARIERSVAGFAIGVAVMGVLGVPSVLVLLWGRERKHAQFMASVGGVLFGKLALVGVAAVYVWTQTGLPRLEFVFGLMAGWIGSFVAMAVILRRTLVQTASPEAKQ